MTLRCNVREKFMSSVLEKNYEASFREKLMSLIFGKIYEFNFSKMFLCFNLKYLLNFFESAKIDMFCIYIKCFVDFAMNCLNISIFLVRLK